MKIEDVAQIRTATSRDENPKAIISRQWTAYRPIDREKEALVEAIKAATIYSGAQVAFSGVLDGDDSLKAVGELIARANVANPFTCYCILHHEVAVTENDHAGTDLLVCLILFKAVDNSGTTTCAPARFSAFGEVQIVSAHTQASPELAARVEEFCSDATCIAVGNQASIIPLWQA